MRAFGAGCALLGLLAAAAARGQVACEPGSFFDAARQRCVGCAGCGLYQDEANQTTCKTATVDSCPAGSVPRWTSSFATNDGLEGACKEVPTGSFFVDQAGTSSSTCYPVERCEGCGAYQDERGQGACKQATLDSCPAGHVPKLASWFNSFSSLEEACEEVPAGSFFRNDSDACFPVSQCQGCGAFQDEPGQTECKQVQRAECPRFHVPRWARGAATPAGACENVTEGRYFEDRTGETSSTCFPISDCAGCGAYQDEPGQTSCKRATLEACPDGQVPSFIRTFDRPATSLQDACRAVPAGSFFSNQAGDSSSTCFPVETCTGCGAYQDQAGQTSCKAAARADCPANHVPEWVGRFDSGRASPEAACREVPAGYFFAEGAGDSASTCFPVEPCTGCGAYQDEPGQASCKATTVASCGAGRVPREVSSWQPATLPSEACKEVPAGSFYEPSQTACFPVSECTGCGAYQDEPGQTSCKEATLEACPANHVPRESRFGRGRASLEDACEAVEAGYFFTDDKDACYPVERCFGCGVFQDEPGQTQCKLARVEDCPADSVPAWVSSFGEPVTSAAEACKRVGPGRRYEASAGASSSTCFAVSDCTGCGVYQDEPRAVACKQATLATCPAGQVPVFAEEPATSAEAACAPVPPGSMFTNTTGARADECFPVTTCRGCGLFQDEPAQQSCKQADCGAGSMRAFAAGATSAAGACQALPTPPGSFSRDECVYTCAGCGAYQDLADQASCKTASPEDCPAGQFPVLAFGATSARGACAAPAAGEGYDASACSLNRCFGSGTAPLFSCESLKRNGHDDCSSALVARGDWATLETYLVRDFSICAFTSRPTGGCDCSEPPTPAPTPAPTALPDPVPGGSSGLAGSGSSGEEGMSTGGLVALSVAVGAASLLAVGLAVAQLRRRVARRAFDGESDASGASAGKLGMGTLAP